MLFQRVECACILSKWLKHYNISKYYLVLNLDFYISFLITLFSFLSFLVYHSFLSSAKVKQTICLMFKVVLNNDTKLIGLSLFYKVLFSLFLFKYGFYFIY